MPSDLRAHRYFSFINPNRWWLCLVCECACITCWLSPLTPAGLRQDYVGGTSTLDLLRSQSFTSELSVSPDLGEGKEGNDEDCSLLLHLTRSHTLSSIRELDQSLRFLVTPPPTPSTRTLPLAGIAIQPLDQGRSRRMELGSLCLSEGKSFRQGSGWCQQT